MTPPAFQIDDEVEIVGPSIMGSKMRTGNRFEISQLHFDEECERYSANDMPWYPASSLRLVEELKIGDWVEVIGPNECGGKKWIGQIFQISTMHDNAPEFGGRKLFSALNMAWFEASSLRKLTLEEIQQRMQSKVTYEQCGNWLEKRLDAQRDRTDRMDDRLAAIEKCQEEAREYSDNLLKITETQAERIYNLQTRLAILEGEAPEVCDCGPDEGKISISIQVGKNRACGIANSSCPAECLEWVESVLDGMRKER